MILYFADRSMHVMGLASTNLGSGLLVRDDWKAEEVESGVMTFEAYIDYAGTQERRKAEKLTAPGNYILRSYENEHELYTIIDSELDTEKDRIYVYAEDAGLDLLNEVLPEYEAEAAMTLAQYVQPCIAGTGFTIRRNEVSGAKLTLSWDEEMTATERLLSIADSFGAELSFAYRIDRLGVINKYIDFWEKRGKSIGVTLRMGEHVSGIRVKKSVANLATALYVTGGTPTGAKGILAYTDEDNVEYFTWLKYRPSRSGALQDGGASANWIGLSWDRTSPRESESAAAYSWFRTNYGSVVYVVPGSTGYEETERAANGDKRYTWIKFATSDSGGNISDSPAGRTYIGIARHKTTQDKSAKATDYTWYAMTGDDAKKLYLVDNGTITTEDGKYAWVKFGTSSAGAGMSDSAVGKTYAGLRLGMSVGGEGSSTTSYVWKEIMENTLTGGQLVEFPYTFFGCQEFGKSTYTWVRYADDIDGTEMSEKPNSKKYVGLAYGKSYNLPSSAPADYDWHLISGDDFHAINLYGYKYDDGDIYLDGTTLKSRSALAKWYRHSVEGQTDGHITKRWSFNTTHQDVLCEKAVKQLRKVSRMEANYEVDLVDLPRSVKIGDTVRIVDNEGKLYLEARLLELRSSAANAEFQATLGEYKIQTSGLSAKVVELEKALQSVTAQQALYTWTAYADDAYGNGISLNPDGKAYVGTAVNRVEKTPDISDPSIYSWQKTAGDKGEDATVLRIDSSRGVLFKNNYFSTVLTVTIQKGSSTITTAAAMRAEYGASAYLQWYWRKFDDEDWKVMLITDSHITDDGFTLTVTPADVDEKIVFKCDLITD